MHIVPIDLSDAARSARARLETLSLGAARENALPGSAHPAMARVAREAVFADALLGAIHARLEELKGVAK